MTNTPQSNGIVITAFPRGDFKNEFVKLQLCSALKKPLTTFGTVIATTSRIMIRRFTSQTLALGSAILLGLANALGGHYRQYELYCDLLAMIQLGWLTLGALRSAPRAS